MLGLHHGQTLSQPSFTALRHAFKAQLVLCCGLVLLASNTAKAELVTRETQTTTAQEPTTPNADPSGSATEIELPTNSRPWAGFRGGMSVLTGFTGSEQMAFISFGAEMRFGGQFDESWGLYGSTQFNIYAGGVTYSDGEGGWGASASNTAQLMIEHIWARHYYLASGGGISLGPFPGDATGLLSSFSPIFSIRTGIYLFNNSKTPSHAMQVGINCAAQYYDSTAILSAQLQIGFEFF